METIITLDQVGVRYKKRGSIFRRAQYFDALKSITLDVYSGETLGILGRNGAGKSTLLRLLSGVIKPDSGSLNNKGATVSLLALQAGFDKNLSGRDNAVLTGIMHGYQRKVVEQHLNEIHAFSELGDFFFEPVRTYSTGMKSRLGFSISTIFSPDVLLVDEVLSVGDKKFREKAEATMLHKINSNQTVVLVSHSHKQIARLCDRATIIEGGKNIATGDPASVINNYEQMLGVK